MSIDERIGQNLAILRGETSQKDLADRMRERGFKWSQATVWSIERGERPLRLAEAQEVADILSRPLEMLLARDGEAEVNAATRLVSERYNEMLRAMQSYDDARGALALALDQIPEIEKSGWLRIATDWVYQNVDVAVRDYRDTAASEFAAFLARENITQELYDYAGRSDMWVDRYNKALQKFREGGADGLDQAEV